MLKVALENSSSTGSMPVCRPRKICIYPGQKISRRYRLARIRRREFRRLKESVPSLAGKQSVSKVDVVFGAINYIEQLHSELGQRLLAMRGNAFPHPVNSGDMGKLADQIFKTLQEVDALPVGINATVERTTQSCAPTDKDAATASTAAHTASSHPTNPLASWRHLAALSSPSQTLLHRPTPASIPLFSSQFIADSLRRSAFEKRTFARTTAQ